MVAVPFPTKLNPGPVGASVSDAGYRCVFVAGSPGWFQDVARGAAPVIGTPSGATLPPLMGVGKLGPCINYSADNSNRGFQFVQGSQPPVNYTIEALVEIGSSYAAAEGENIIQYSDAGNSGNTWDRSITISPTGLIRCLWYDGSARTISTSGTYANGQVVHVALTAIGSGASTVTTLWVNGVNEGSLTTSPAYTGFSTPRIVFGYANGFTNGGQATVCKHKLYYAAIHQRGFSRSEIAARVADPFGFLRRNKKSVYSVSPDVTVALTGVSATYSAGTLTPSSTVALAGQSATYSQGTVTPSATVALSGSVGTYDQGTVSPGTDTALAGAAATYAQGDLTPSMSVALSGQFATYQQGDIGVGGDKTVALTGIEATYSQGTLTAGTGGTDTHDGWIRQRHYARTLAKIAEERRRATVEEARAIRAEIQAIIEDAADVPATPAVKSALNAVNRAAPARTAEASTVPQIAGMGDLRTLHRALDALAQAVAYEKMIDEDDNDVLLLI